METKAERAEYDRLYAWRARWNALANSRERGRSCKRQERIERRAAICNLKIGVLMRSFDLRVENSINAISDKALQGFEFDVLRQTVGI